MSSPENPLNKFRTFSYYFIFGVADSTEKALEIASESSNLSLFSQADPRRIILLNGAKDTRFIIKSVEINSILNPSGAHSGESFYHTMNLEGKIIIQEPLGIRFYEELSNAAIQFGTETTSMVFFLKPIFVGYNIDGPSETISTVKPYLFLITQLTSVIDEGGAIYTLETFGIVNGAAKLPQFQSVAGGFNVEITPEETVLSNALQKLEDSLNEHFNNKCETNKENLKKVGLREGFDKKKIPIRYRFHLDTEYQDGKYLVGTNIDDSLKEISTEKYIIHQGARAGIEELIRKLMNSCEAVINERGVDTSGNIAVSEAGNLIGESRPTTKCYLYKIHSSIDLSKDETTINYYIHKYEAEFVPIENKNFPEPGVELTFDYIYTGKNIDIKEFQINMKLGTLFFHNVYTSDNLHLNESQGRGKQSVAASSYTGSSGVPLDEIDSNDPPTQHCSGSSTPILDNEARQTPYPVSTGSYYAMLKRWSSLENLGIELVIKGNPDLMDKSVFIPEDLEFGNRLKSTGKPLYIKMNIQFPEHYSNPRGNFKKFWYDGPYYILTIKNIFDENGDFSQNILMYAMHTDYYGDITARDEHAEESTESTGITGGGSSLAANYNEIKANLQKQIEPQQKSTGTGFTTGGSFDEPFTSEDILNKISPELDKIKQMKNDLQNTKSEMEDLSSILGGVQAARSGISSGVGAVRGGIDGVRKEMDRYKDMIGGIQQQIQQIEQVKGQVQGMAQMSAKQPIKLAQALNEEYHIMERLNITPDNIMNVINKKAPVLLETWKTAEESLDIVKQKYGELQSTYNEVRSLYEEVANLKNIIA